MALPERHIFSIERIADRWRVDAAFVNELVRTRQLPQAFLISGSARLLIRGGSGSIVQHPAPRIEPVRARLLVSAPHTMPNDFRWPLSQVRRIYEFVADDRFGRLSLKQYCDQDRAKSLGWAIEFDQGRSILDGHDNPLVELGDLLEYEVVNRIGHASAKERAESGRLRDSRRQRCRVAAAIIWKNDPKATLVRVFRHEWVQEIACEGRPPTEKAFREWVKDLNPNRNPGRRRK